MNFNETYPHPEMNKTSMGLMHRIDRIMMLCEVAGKTVQIARDTADGLFGPRPQSVGVGDGGVKSCNPPPKIEALDAALDKLECEIRRGQEEICRLAEI